jgi:hypothetical protein
MLFKHMKQNILFTLRRYIFNHWCVFVISKFNFKFNYMCVYIFNLELKICYINIYSFYDIIVMYNLIQCNDV